MVLLDTFLTCNTERNMIATIFHTTWATISIQVGLLFPYNCCYYVHIIVATIPYNFGYYFHTALATIFIQLRLLFPYNLAIISILLGLLFQYNLGYYFLTTWATIFIQLWLLFPYNLGYFFLKFRGFQVL